MTEIGLNKDTEQKGSSSDNQRISKEAPISAGLYVVATPIGNLEDLSNRAKRILESVDFIACEDTRISSKLLNAFLIKKPLISYHEHSSDKDRNTIIVKLQAGASIALISDAGTPLISDPGYKLVMEVQNLGINVVAIPGPSAVATALSIAGMPTDRFMFMGFPPNKHQARLSWFEEAAKIKATLVFYESTRRLPDCIKDAFSVFGDREVAVCRELTKKFEEVRRDTLLNISNYYQVNGAPKGEAVVIIGPPKKERDPEHSIDKENTLKLALQYMSVKSASQFVAELTGSRKKELYARALELTQDNKDT
jgi:16S rRNA (cytidine1402-2'-O)-methyltransferase